MNSIGGKLNGELRGRRGAGKDGRANSIIVPVKFFPL